MLSGLSTRTNFSHIQFSPSDLLLFRSIFSLFDFRQNSFVFFSVSDLIRYSSFLFRLIFRCLWFLWYITIILYESLSSWFADSLDTTLWILNQIVMRIIFLIFIYRVSLFLFIEHIVQRNKHWKQGNQKMREETKWKERLEKLPASYM